MAIKSEMLTISGPGGDLPGYLACPDSSSAPGIVVIQEIFGVNVHIRSIADRLAEAGYAALAPDMFWRVRPGIELGYTPEDVAAGRDYKSAMVMEDNLKDVKAAFDLLAARPQCAGRKQGIIGFCWGGYIAYMAAVRLSPAASSSFYGGGIVGNLAEAGNLKSPIQFHFGETDGSIPQDDVTQIKTATAANPLAEVFIYPEAGHGFHCDMRGSYHPESSKIAWQRSQDLFSANLQ